MANKVAVVTGGGSGIGRATALALVQAGAAVVIGNRNVRLGEEAVLAIQQQRGRAVFQATDVTQPQQVQALVQRAVQEFGRLDLAFNNAGVDGQQLPLHEQDIDQASQLFDVNIKGIFYSMKYEIEQMLQSGGGAIVNCSSIFGLNGFPGWSLYGATKHASASVTKAAALDYAKLGINTERVTRLRVAGTVPRHRYTPARSAAEKSTTSLVRPACDALKGGHSRMPALPGRLRSEGSSGMACPGWPGRGKRCIKLPSCGK